MYDISNKTPLARSSGKVALCCGTCGMVFERHAAWAKKAANHYCGRGCADEARKVRVPCECVVCGSTFEQTPANAARVVTCSRRCHRLKKARHFDDLSGRIEALAARTALADSVTHCAQCLGRFGPEVRCVEGMKYTLAEDGVTAIPDAAGARVVCRACHMHEVAPFGTPARQARAANGA